MQYSIAPGSIISVYVQSSHSSAALHGRIAECRLERMLNTSMQRLQTCATQQVHVRIILVQQQQQLKSTSAAEHFLYLFNPVQSPSHAHC